MKRNEEKIELILSNIRRLRKEKKIRQKEMSSILGFKGESGAGYLKIENGKNNLSFDLFFDICKILDIKSYNDILPAINDESIEKFKQSIWDAKGSFVRINSNARMAKETIESIKNKLETDEFKTDLISDLEILSSYFSIVEKESKRSEISLRELFENVEKLD